MIKRIKLHGKYTEQFGHYALVDAADHAELSKHRWRVTNGGYAISGATAGHPDRPLLIMHRLIVGAPSDTVVDHINGLGLDNRRSNLRCVSHSANARNVGSRGGVSQYKGVYWRKNRSKWMAVALLPDGSKKTVGSFDNELQAAHAYNRVMRQYHGNTYRLNDLTGGFTQSVSALIDYISGAKPCPSALPLPDPSNIVHPDAVMQIPLTGKYGEGKFALVSGCDYRRLSAFRWHVMPSGYVTVHHKGKTTYMHRCVMDAPTGMVIDHIDRNKLNNTRSNLRVATATENSFNAVQNRPNAASQYRGVSYYPSRQAWNALVTIKKEQSYLGQYLTEHEAAEAVNGFLAKEVGDFAILNEIPDNLPPSPQRQGQRKANKQTAPYKWVYWDKRSNQWYIEVTKGVKGNRIRRTEYGFPDPESAARAADRIALDIHGPMIRLNFPSSEPEHHSPPK